MQIFRTMAAYLGAVAITFIFAAGFYTQQVLAKQAAIGAVYTAQQQFDTYVGNALGLLPAYAPILAIALLVGFLVAAGVKRILKPLAPVAYPVAGAAAVFTAIWAIETFAAAGGAGAIAGARGVIGIGLQCLAGGLGGMVFAVLKGRSR